MAKVIPREKFVAMMAYIKKSEISQINKLMMYFKVLEKTRTSQT
jgi:hypothetical protein